MVEMVGVKIKIMMMGWTGFFGMDEGYGGGCRS